MLQFLTELFINLFTLGKPDKRDKRLLPLFLGVVVILAVFTQLYEG